MMWSIYYNIHMFGWEASPENKRFGSIPSKEILYILVMRGNLFVKKSINQFEWIERKKERKLLVL